MYEAVQKLTEVDFALAAVENLDWDHDMSPWPCPPISKRETPCTGVLRTTYELNPGGHFQSGTERMARRAVWILERWD
ncbi:MAG: hypothetical protein K6C08_03205 [Oscillospiraceae bacterium]|nr:hypothetical protein [Oscillospiraceae bacterium]